jgi:hypothetical protein
VAWREWLDEQMNVPTQESHYLMQLTAVWLQTQLTKKKDREAITGDTFRLRFSRRDSAAALTPEEKVLANPELYDAPPVMTKEKMAAYHRRMRVATMTADAKAQAKARKLAKVKVLPSGDRLQPGEETGDKIGE